MKRTAHFVLIALLALWWGGLSVYVFVVVPAGSRVFGAADQGFVTQRVTNQLNLLGAVCLAALFRRQALAGWGKPLLLWLTMGGSLLAAHWLHRYMDALLDTQTHSVLDSDAFFWLHQGYLWVTVLQMLVGLAQLWIATQPAQPVSRDITAAPLRGESPTVSSE